MERIDHCNYEHQGFRISYNADYGVWEVRDPNGEFLANRADLKEAMIFTETEATYEEDN